MIFEESIDEAAEIYADELQRHIASEDMTEDTSDEVYSATEEISEDAVVEDVRVEETVAEDTIDETLGGKLLEQVESSSGWKLEQIDHEKSEKDIQEERVVEAVLFTMGRSVEVRQLAAALDSDEESARAAAIRLQVSYEKNRCAMQIIELEDSYQMCTREMYYENLIKVAKTPKKQVLTDVILEVLSIIAYKQPVTKAQINKIRGVNSDHSVSKLVEYGLIYEAGRLDAPGRPTLFATTEEFLRRFGVGSKKDLPQTTPDQVALIEHEVAEEVNYRFGTEPGTDEASEELDRTRESALDISSDILDENIDETMEMALDESAGDSSTVESDDIESNNTELDNTESDTTELDEHVFGDEIIDENFVDEKVMDEQTEPQESDEKMISENDLYSDDDDITTAIMDDTSDDGEIIWK